MADVRILLVEDDYIIAKELRLTLESLGFTVLGSVESGEQALAWVTTERPDIVLLDINLAGQLTGIDTAEQLHRLYPALPFIFLTALADIDTLRQAKQTEPFAYLTKPVDTMNLFAAIELALQQSARLQMAETPAPALRDTLKITGSIFVRAKKRLEKVHLSDVLWIEASDIYVTVVTATTRYLLSLSMKHVEERFPSANFLRVHRSYIVQVDKINAIEDDELLINNQRIPVGKTYRDGLMKRLQIL